MSIVLDGTAGITTPEIVSTGGPLVVNASAPDNSVVVNASGNVGIGTSSPSTRLQVNGGRAVFTGSNENYTVGIGRESNTNAYFLGVHSTTSPDLVFSNNAGNERMRLTDSGQLNIGPFGGAGNAVVAGSSSPSFTNQPGTNLLLKSGDGSGTGSSFMSFSTSPAGSSGTTINTAVERARITSAGDLLVGTTSAFGSARFCVQNSTSRNAISAKNDGSGNDLYNGLASNNAEVFAVRASGNVVNANNSYGGISDAKLKENITDATPKLDKLNQVRVVNYNLIGDTQKLLGVVAQELEQIFPGMVDESPDRDKEGNDLGTTTKSVKYSVFVPMLIKAMQELKAINDAQAQTIESLTARVVALEQA